MTIVWYTKSLIHLLVTVDNVCKNVPRAGAPASASPANASIDDWGAGGERTK